MWRIVFLLGVRRMSAVMVQNRALLSRFRGVVLFRQPHRAYSFETFSFAPDSADECVLLEKSIRSGCSSVYTSKSKAFKGTVHDFQQSNVVEVYELLSDLTSTEEVRLEDFQLGHCLDLHPDTIERELQIIHSVLPATRKSLDFATLMLQSPGETPSEVFDVTSLKSAVTAIDMFPHFNGSLGFHFSTALLANISTQELDEALSTVSSALEGVERPLLVAIATNYLSQESALRVAKWAKNKNAKIMACEVLRMDERRPGLLGLPASSATSGSISINATLSTKNAVLQAMENLKVSMDRCLHMERQYMEKLHEAGEGEEGSELVRQLCVAHVLVHIQNNLHSLEEWDYLLRNDIDPRFEAALEKVKKQSKAAAEWASLYTGLARHLFSSMSVLHRTKKYMICDDILKSMGVSSSKDGTPQTVEKVEKLGGKIPPLLAAAAKNLLDADYVALSGIEIHMNQWEQLAEEQEGGGRDEAQQKQAARTTFSKIDSVCASYV